MSKPPSRADLSDALLDIFLTLKSLTYRIDSVCNAEMENHNRKATKNSTHKK